MYELIQWLEKYPKELEIQLNIGVITKLEFNTCMKMVKEIKYAQKKCAMLLSPEGEPDE